MLCASLIEERIKNKKSLAASVMSSNNNNNNNNNEAMEIYNSILLNIKRIKENFFILTELAIN